MYRMKAHGYMYEYDPTGAEHDIVRIYDLDGQHGTQAKIRVYRNEREWLIPLQKFNDYNELEYSKCSRINKKVILMDFRHVVCEENSV